MARRLLADLAKGASTARLTREARLARDSLESQLRQGPRK